MTAADKDAPRDDSDIAERIKAMTGFNDEQLHQTWSTMISHLESQPEELQHLLVDPPE